MKDELDRLRSENDRLREEVECLRALVAATEQPAIGPRRVGEKVAFQAEGDLFAVVPDGGSIVEPPFESKSVESTPIRSTAQKLAIFRRYFRGRDDVFAIRWESASGRHGYSPACANEWKPGVCFKPRVKCAECGERRFLHVTDQVVFDHLSGRSTIGLYPLLTDDRCCFLAVDFDEAGWREDSLAFVATGRELRLPVALEISRSGAGAHAWMFFYEAIPAADARRLGEAMISRTCERTRQLSLASYDRLFPNQATLPKGGFGNLIALPFQRQPTEDGFTLFVDEQFHPYPDQWGFLESLGRLSAPQVSQATRSASSGRHPLDVAFVSSPDDSGDDRAARPWERRAPEPVRLPGPMPESVTIVRAQQIYVAKAGLPHALTNRLIRLAAFQNPEFYRAQAMRMPVWNKPRIIGCAENLDDHLALPRGCEDDIVELLARHEIRVEIQDECALGRPVNVAFQGTLRPDQEEAARAMLAHRTGVLSAPTAFGKTVVAAWLIAKRGTSTLVLVHRTDLLDQWRERMAGFLASATGVAGPETSGHSGAAAMLNPLKIGAIGGGKNRAGGFVDIAVMQSLSRRTDLDELLDRYGQIIVDECHHVSAFSFEAILKRAKASYVLGLTATAIRRDGHHPIIFMQCSPVRHVAARPESAPSQLQVIVGTLPAPVVPSDAKIQEVFRMVATDPLRLDRIATDVTASFREGRKILVLTERTDQLGLLRAALEPDVHPCYVLHGRLKRAERAAILSDLGSMDSGAPVVILATGRLIGEGFDHPPLDTLVLAMPISWKGTLQQYVGRLHREHATKRDVRVYDYMEPDSAPLARMWEKRRKGYVAMGYVVGGA